jgi:hypothetical protein
VEGINVTQIDGFVPLASYDEDSRRRQSGHSPEWKLLREAISSGDIDGFQHGGSKRWLVHKAQADRMLEKRRRTVAVSDGPDEGRTEMDCLVSLEETLAEIRDILRRQEVSAESLDRPVFHPEGFGA